MNILLIFFALPIATIIISIALQKILKCPPLVAAIIFAIFLVVTFVINSLTFLVATIVYTIISFITAVIVCIICRILERNRRNYDYNNDCFACGCKNNSNNLLSINSNCQNNNNGDLLTISSCDCNSNNCGNNFNNSNGVTARINVIPTTNNNRRNSYNCGCCRRS